MKLASLKSGGRDGTLVVVDRSGTRYRAVPEIAATLQAALEDWWRVSRRLEDACRALNDDPRGASRLEPAALAAVLPRSYQWLDGSAYLSHVERVRRARGASMPESLLTDPLMYQGGADALLAPYEPFRLVNPAWGLDFEAEIGVITDDVPQGVDATDARGHIRLVVLINDWSLRNLIPDELAKGFGFVHGKPPSALSPFAVSPRDLGGAWDGGRLHGALVSEVNGEVVGRPDAGEGMQFDFGELISHAARTRNLGAGTLIGSGTVSNADAARGCSCLVERRMLELLADGAARTPFLVAGDRVRIEMPDGSGGSRFGAIDQRVVAAAA